MNGCSFKIQESRYHTYLQLVKPLCSYHLKLQKEDGGDSQSSNLYELISHYDKSM